MSDCTSLSLNLRPINRLANLSAQDYIKVDGAWDLLGIIYCTNRVGGVLILSCVSDQTFLVVELNVISELVLLFSRSMASPGTSLKKITPEACLRAHNRLKTRDRDSENTYGDV